MGLPDKAQKVFDKAIELDKKILKKVEDKLNLSDYQSKCANFVIGFLIGAILLWYRLVNHMDDWHPPGRSLLFNLLDF